MDLHLKLLIGMVVISKAYTSPVKINPTGINWFNASKECEEDGFGLEHDLLILSNMTELQYNEFWIGTIKYDELTPWIELIGCYRLLHTDKTTQNTVGYCEQCCRSWPYFSYKESTKECQCLNEDDFRNLHKVDFRECHHHVPVKNVTILYQHFTYNNDNDGKEKCMVLKCKQDGMVQSPRMCNYKNASSQTVCDGFIIPTSQSWDIDYDEAKTACLKMGKNLISPQNCSTVITGFAWTSVFRQVVTVEHLNGKTGLIQAVCLSGRRVNISESENILKTYRPCNNTLEYFVCRSNISMELPTTRPDHETSSDIDFDSETTRDMGTVKVCGTHRPSSSSNLNTISTTLSFTSEDDNVVMLSSSSNTGAVVGGVFGGIVILVIVTLLLFWKLRRKNKAAKPKGVETNGSQNESSVLKHVSNMQYGLVEVQKSSVPEYAVIQKDDKLPNKQIPGYAVVQKESKTSALDDNYVTVSEGNYDKLNNVLSRKVIPDANVYDMVGKCAEGEYDTMKRVSVTNFNQPYLYDTTVSMRKEINGDQTYDSASKTQCRRHGCDDSYNHS